MPKIPITPPSRFTDEVANQLTATEIIDCVCDPIPGEEGFVLRKRGGLWLWWYESMTGGIDGMFWWPNKAKLIVVCSGRIFVFTSLTAAPTEISTESIRLHVDVQVQFTTNGNWVFMCNGHQIVAWNGTDSTATLINSQPPSSGLAFLNNVILAQETDTARVRFTDAQTIETATLPTWSTEFFTPDANPDRLKVIAGGWGEALLIGDRSTEFWYYSGDETIPFARNSGAFIERGISAVGSLVNLDNTWYWLDHEHFLIRLSGRSPEVISTPFQRTFKNMGHFSDARGFIIDQRFYCLAFPLSGYCLVYDLISRGWYKWAFWNSDTGLYERFLGQCSVYIPEWDTQFVGGRKNAEIYIYHDNLMTDNNNIIRGIYETPHLDWGTMKQKQANRLYLRLKRGA